MNKIAKSFMAIMLFVITGLLFSLISCSDIEPEWVKQSLEAQRLIEEGRYDEGIELSLDALKLSDEAYNNDYRAISRLLYVIGVAYQEQGKYAEAETFLKRSLKVLEDEPVYTTSLIPLALNRLALLYFLQERYEDAETFSERALKWRRGIC